MDKKKFKVVEIDTLKVEEGAKYGLQAIIFRKSNNR